MWDNFLKEEGYMKLEDLVEVKRFLNEKGIKISPSHLDVRLISIHSNLDQFFEFILHKWAWKILFHSEFPKLWDDVKLKLNKTDIKRKAELLFSYIHKYIVRDYFFIRDEHFLELMKITSWKDDLLIRDKVENGEILLKLSFSWGGWITIWVKEEFKFVIDELVKLYEEFQQSQQQQQ
jgi:hypothetical protein